MIECKKWKSDLQFLQKRRQTMKNKQLSLSALTLRLLALMFMLLDHMWATVIPGNNWMTWLGRLAFPIFAFQLAEGCCLA